MLLEHNELAKITVILFFIGSGNVFPLLSSLTHMKEPLVINVPVPQSRIAVQFWYPNKSVLRYVLSTIGVGIKVRQP